MTDQEWRHVQNQLRYRAKKLARFAHAANCGLDADDLFQDGALAALKAEAKWRPDCGSSVVTWCVWRGWGAMLDQIRIHAKQFRRGERKGDPFLVERVKVCSLASPVPFPVSGRRQEGAVSDNIGKCDPDRTHTRSEFRKAVRAVSGGLSDKEADAVTLYFFDDLTMKVTAEVIGVQESRVSQMLAVAERSIRERAEAEGWAEGDVAELLGVS